MLTHDHKPRGAKFALLLILLLAGSNLATAIGAYLVIDRISNRYVEEINATAPGMHDVMVLAQKATNVHRAAAALLVARNPAERNRMLDQLDEARAREAAQRNQLLDTPKNSPDAVSAREALAKAAVGYEAALNTYLELLKKEGTQAAHDFRLADLRTAFELYQQRQQEESIRLNLEAMQGGRDLSTYASTRKSWLLSIGAWPLVMFGLVLIAVTVLGMMLWQQLQRMETDEHDPKEPQRRIF